LTSTFSFLDLAPPDIFVQTRVHHAALGDGNDKKTDIQRRLQGVNVSCSA